MDKTENKKESQSRRFEWRKKMPSDLKEVKRVNIKEYHWRPKHTLWTLHKPKECKLAELKEEVNRGDKGSNAKQWRLANALSAIQSENDGAFKLRLRWWLLNMTCSIIALQWPNKKEFGGINIVGIICVYYYFTIYLVLLDNTVCNSNHFTLNSESTPAP